MNWLAVLLSSVNLWCHMPTTEGQSLADSEWAAVQGTNQFSKKLYQVLTGGDDNLVVSPFSVEAVAAMLLLGLRGDTEKRISKALFLPENRSHWAPGFKSIFTSLQATQDVTLAIANKIYVQQGFRMKQEFRNETTQYFNSVAEEVDIARKAETVRLAVNDWASKQTQGRIQNLLAPGSLDGVVMILLNAIYFKGIWKTQFKTEDTKDRIFYLSSGSEKNVPMMNLHSTLRYAEPDNLNAQVLKLPYKGGKFSMLILLPKAKQGLSRLESKLDQLNVADLLAKLRNEEVYVTLPKFKILNEIQLNDPLTKIGLGELFKERGGADFSGVTDESIYISKALQKAFIEVNEEGTEAAAVTAFLGNIITSVGAAPPRQVYYFIADHPFMYMIVEEEKGTILFLGRVTEPKE